MSTIFKSCHKCQDRYPGCHDKCEKYLAEKAEWEKAKEHLRKEKEDLMFILYRRYKT